jgi:hypothetical protein
MPGFLNLGRLSGRNLRLSKLKAKGSRQMRSRKWSFVAVAIVWLGILFGCNLTKKTASTNAPASDKAEEATGVEKVKPAPGTGNVQGKVFLQQQAGREYRSEVVRVVQSLSRRLQREDFYRQDR